MNNISNDVINSVPYLRTSREFPSETADFTQEVSKTYIDIAAAVNNRTIGIFPVTRPAITGESWFFNASNRKQNFRQVYTFDAIAAGAPTFSFAHNISNLSQFTAIYGTCITDQQDYRPIPYAAVAASMDANIEINVDADDINITVGVNSPNIVSGLIILEWFA